VLLILVAAWYGKAASVSFLSLLSALTLYKVGK
jgi:hypothetical protein